MREQDAMKFLCERNPVKDTQITREIDYFLDFYNNPKPTVYLSYEREAFFSKTDSDFRMTFDRNICGEITTFHFAKEFTANRF